MLTEIFLEVARRVDGAALVKESLAQGADGAPPGRVHALAVGKVAFPMFEGWVATVGAASVASGLLVAPPTRFPTDLRLPPTARALMADHPSPSARSAEAAVEVRAFVARLTPDDRLVVLLSGGGSSLLAAPAAGLSLEDKRAAIAAVARGGATIAELNTVRKHLSAVKGGQLGLATPAQVTVLALSDVVGNDPGTIASGPFSADPTTFGEALGVLDRLGAGAPPAAREHLARGAAGHLPETPKPGDPRLGHISYRILAGPERVPEEARRLAAARGASVGMLAVNTEIEVSALAAAYTDRARQEAGAAGGPRVLVGNGEPRIVVRGEGRGGRATHLALLMARGIAGLPGVAFLAAGTDDRDGSADASGAVVDGTTWQRAVDAGLDPAAALGRCDSAAPLEALGCLVRGPGSSNLLDLHLMFIPAA